jgi:hypothetical protein
MDRHKLIGAHFDAYSDLKWVTDLEPKFKANLWDTAEIEEFREAWRGLSEARDWDSWQEKVKGMSDAELKREIAECHAEIASYRTSTETDRERFKRIMEGKAEKQPVQQVTKDRGREV